MSLEPPPTVPCPRCEGEGGWEVFEEWEHCDLCDGAKVVPLSVVCAWQSGDDCQDLLRGPDPYASGGSADEIAATTSHGICAPCKTRVEAESEKAMSEETA